MTELEEYKQVLAFLLSNGTTQVLAPIDGDGREFWTTAEADPLAAIELEIGGVVKTYERAEAIAVLERTIALLEAV